MSTTAPLLTSCRTIRRSPASAARIKGVHPTSSAALTSLAVAVSAARCPSRMLAAVGPVAGCCAGAREGDGGEGDRGETDPCQVTSPRQVHRPRTAKLLQGATDPLPSGYEWDPCTLLKLLCWGSLALCPRHRAGGGGRSVTAVAQAAALVALLAPSARATPSQGCRRTLSRRVFCDGGAAPGKTCPRHVGRNPRP
jgi:hypothetical protein